MKLNIMFASMEANISKLNDHDYIDDK